MPFLIGLVLPLEPQKPTFPSLPCLVMGVREEEEEITLWMIFAAFLTVETLDKPIDSAEDLALQTEIKVGMWTIV